MSNVTCDRSGTQGAAEGLPDSDSSVGYPLPEPFPVNTHLEKKAITAASYDVALAWSKVETCLMSRNYSKVCKTALEVMHQTPTGETSQTWVSFQTEGEDYMGLDVPSRITDWQGMTSVPLTYFKDRNVVEQGDPVSNIAPPTLGGSAGLLSTDILSAVEILLRK